MSDKDNKDWREHKCGECGYPISDGDGYKSCRKYGVWKSGSFYMESYFDSLPACPDFQPRDEEVKSDEPNNP